ncbi:MAG: hypothetical protein L0271_08800 [Gemmatimonadetes bacterium]|nr:hypothetical protein [Gemmatimonadota bacterium]
MTLFEALVALVILGLASLGLLGAFEGASRATRNAAAWVQAAGYAEAALEETRLGTASDALMARSLPEGFAQDIAVQPWPGATGIERVSVTIRLPDGGAFVVHRLVRSP